MVMVVVVMMVVPAVMMMMCVCVAVCLIVVVVVVVVDKTRHEIVRGALLFVGSAPTCFSMLKTGIGYAALISLETGAVLRHKTRGRRIRSFSR